MNIDFDLIHLSILALIKVQHGSVLVQQVHAARRSRCHWQLLAAGMAKLTSYYSYRNWWSSVNRGIVGSEKTWVAATECAFEELIMPLHQWRRKE